MTKYLTILLTMFALASHGAVIVSPPEGGGSGGLSAGTNSLASMSIVPGDGVVVSTSTTTTNINPYSVSTGTGVDIGLTTGYFTNQSEGYYWMYFSASIDGTGSDVYEFVIETNDTATTISGIQTLDASADAEAVSGGGIVWLPASSTINLAARNQTGANVMNVSNLTFTVGSWLSGTNAANSPFGGIQLITDTGISTLYLPSSDTDASRGLALSNAQANASSGDEIWVGPGTYHMQEVTIGRDGLYYYFNPGAVVTGDSSTSNLISDANSDADFVVDGYGSFFSTNLHLLAIKNTNSVITVRAKEIVGLGNNAVGVQVRGGQLTVYADVVESKEYDSLWINNGNGNVVFRGYFNKLVCGTNASVNQWLEYDDSSGGTASNNFYVSAQEIRRVDGAYGSNPQDEYPHSNFTFINEGTHNIWLDLGESLGTNVIASISTNANVNVTITGERWGGVSVSDSLAAINTLRVGGYIETEHANAINAAYAQDVIIIGSLSANAAIDSDATITQGIASEDGIFISEASTTNATEMGLLSTYNTLRNIEAGNDIVLTNSGTKIMIASTAAAGGGSPGGSDRQVQYNNSSSFDGASGITIPGSSGETNLNIAGITATHDLTVSNALEILGSGAAGILRLKDDDSSAQYAFSVPGTLDTSYTNIFDFGASPTDTDRLAIHDTTDGVITWTNLAAGAGSGEANVLGYDIDTNAAMMTLLLGKTDVTNRVRNIQATNGITLHNDSTYITISNSLGSIGTDIQAFDALLDDIAGLSDPGVDRLMGWDNTDNDVRFFVIGSGLSYDDGTDTLTATASGSPEGDSGAVQFVQGSSFAGTNDFLFDRTNAVLTVGLGASSSRLTYNGVGDAVGNDFNFLSSASIRWILENATGDIYPASSNAYSFGNITKPVDELWVDDIQINQGGITYQTAPKGYVYIDAGAMIGATTDGASLTTFEGAGDADDKKESDYMAFAATGSNTVFFTMSLNDWDASTVKFKMHFSVTNSAATQTNVFEFSALSLGSGDSATNTAWGTAVVLTNAINANTNFANIISAATIDMTIGNTPSVGDMLKFRIRRLPDHPDDTASDHTLLDGVDFEYGKSLTPLTGW